jgi:hypothetical protein
MKALRPADSIRFLLVCPSTSELSVLLPSLSNMLRDIFPIHGCTNEEQRKNGEKDGTCSHTGFQISLEPTEQKSLK